MTFLPQCVSCPFYRTYFSSSCSPSLLFFPRGSLNCYLSLSYKVQLACIMTYHSSTVMHPVRTGTVVCADGEDLTINASHSPPAFSEARSDPRRVLWCNMTPELGPNLGCPELFRFLGGAQQPVFVLSILWNPRLTLQYGLTSFHFICFYENSQLDGPPQNRDRFIRYQSLILC